MMHAFQGKFFGKHKEIAEFVLTLNRSRRIPRRI